MTTETTSKTEELLRRLTEGVEQLTTSEEWTRYLDTQRKFHHYSFGNCLLIALQSPDATRVAGFHRWLELGRHVRKGEKGIAILAPIVRRLKVEDADGEEHTIASAPRSFRVVHVFALEQTDGDDLPEIPCHRLQGDGAAYPELVAYAQSCGFRVTVDELPGEINGLCDHTQKTLTLRAGLEPAQHTKTLIHEIAHSQLHGPSFEGSRNQAELEAESVAFIVMSTLGLNSGEYSFGYCASWAGGGAEAIAAIRACAGRIQKAAATIIDALELEPVESFALAGVGARLSEVGEELVDPRHH